MFKKYFILIALSCAVMTSPQANYSFPNFNLYKIPKKNTLRSYKSSRANILPYKRGLSRQGVRYGGYMTIGSDLHLPLPSFLTGNKAVSEQNSTKQNHRFRSNKANTDLKSSKNLLSVHSYSSLAIPFELSTTEKLPAVEKYTIALEKYWFPIDIALGYRIMQNVAFEGALPIGLLSADKKSNSIICLPNVAMKIIMPYDRQLAFFVKIGGIAPMALIQQAKRTDAYLPNKSSANKPASNKSGVKALEMPYHPWQWGKQFTWTAALGGDCKLNSKVGVHASLNWIGGLKIKEKKTSKIPNVVESHQSPAFIKVSIYYNAL